MITNQVPRLRLLHLPTPVQELSHLGRELDRPRLFAKRDDLTGLANGGNKTRKLEFSVADALTQDADTLITVGAAQSNHCCQAAAAAARLGLRCILVLGGTSPESWNGNLLLDSVLGAQIVWAGSRERHEVMAEVAERERAAGYRPYQIPLGASNEVGACGYVAAMEELLGQLAAWDLRVDHIVVASGSGGTQAGMTVGARALGFRGRVVGIAIELTRPELQAILAPIANRTAHRLGLDLTFAPGDFPVYDGYLGGGYGVLGDLERDAIRLMARTEGIFVDPVYTGRALGGFMDLLRKGEFGRDDTVLFWHTGGQVALFAYAPQLL